MGKKAVTWMVPLIHGFSSETLVEERIVFEQPGLLHLRVGYIFSLSCPTPFTSNCRLTNPPVVNVVYG